jgi:hypothetical protein
MEDVLCVLVAGWVQHSDYDLDRGCLVLSARPEPYLVERESFMGGTAQVLG